MEQNGYHNVTAIEKAVSDRSGTCTLYQSDFNTADHLTLSTAQRADVLSAKLARVEAQLVANARQHVFLFGTLLLATAVLLACNLCDEITAQPIQAPVKVEA